MYVCYGHYKVLPKTTKCLAQHRVVRTSFSSLNLNQTIQILTTQRKESLENIVEKSLIRNFAFSKFSVCDSTILSDDVLVCLTRLFLCTYDYFVCFRLFIVATSYPSERRPQKKVSCYRG